jgi:hypothetical protein
MTVVMDSASSFSSRENSIPEGGNEVGNTEARRGRVEERGRKEGERKEVVKGRKRRRRGRREILEDGGDENILKPGG